MKIGAAAHQHAEPRGQAAVDVLVFGRVIRVIHLDGVEAAIDERHDQARRASSRRDARTTPRRRPSWITSTTVAGLGPGPRHKRRPAGGEPAIERLLHRRRRDRPRTSRRASCGRPDRRARAAPRPRAAPPRRRSACPARPAASPISRTRATRSARCCRETPPAARSTGSKKYPSMCTSRPSSTAVISMPGTTRMLAACAAVGDLGNRRDGVVIGHADGGEAGGRGARHELGRRQPAVGGGRVQVKVDQR